MSKSAKTIAIILARGNSERLPGKNIKLLNGKPMIQYTIEAGLACKEIDSVVVSTDSEEIQKISVELGAKAPFLRPKNLASASATSYDALIHAVDAIERIENKVFQTVILLQPTSPFTTSKMLDDAITIFNNESVDNLISVCKTNKKVQWFGRIEENHFHNLNLEVDQKIKQFIPSGNFYIYNRKALKTPKNLKSPYAYEVDLLSAVDIDEDIDFKFAEFLMQNI